MNKKISVILPVYNAELYLSKCIRSILNQTYTHFELIIINDGSLDKSLQIAQSFKDDRIKIFNKKNAGVSKSRNFGIKKATGDYIYMLDSDDWIEANLLDACISSIKKHNADLIVFGYKLDKEDKNGKIVSSSTQKHQNIVYNRSIDGKTITNEIVSSLGFVWNKFYKASYIKENNLQFIETISLFEDVLFNLNGFKYTNQIVFVEEVLYHYVDRPTVSLSKKYRRNISDLSKLKNNVILDFLTSWRFDSKAVKSIMANLIYKDTKYQINSLFSYNNKLRIFEKIKSIQQILNNEILKSRLPDYTPTTIKDKFYLFLIKYKLTLLIYLINKIIK